MLNENVLKVEVLDFLILTYLYSVIYSSVIHIIGLVEWGKHLKVYIITPDILTCGREEREVYIKNYF